MKIDQFVVRLATDGVEEGQEVVEAEADVEDLYKILSNH